MNNNTYEMSKIIVLGNVDAGKSTIVGTLVYGKLDNGDGSSRSRLHLSAHEKSSGRTSTRTPYYLIKHDESGSQLVTTLIDLCGHEKYLSTTITGMTGLYGDFGILIVAANHGMIGSSKEHMGLMEAIKIPYLILITKVDMCPPDVLRVTKTGISKLIRRRRKCFEIESGSVDDIRTIVDSFHRDKFDMVPVIECSSKTGHNINFIYDLLTNLRSVSRRNLQIPLEERINDRPTYSPVFFIDAYFTVKGIGIVLGGTMRYGEIRKGQSIWLGPVGGEYVSVFIKSIMNPISQEVDVLYENNSGSIAIRLAKKGSYHKGFYRRGQIATPDLDFAVQNTCRYVVAEMGVFKHATTISTGYKPTIHCRMIRQSGKLIISQQSGSLRTGDRADVCIKFIQRPEFILPSSRLILREGTSRGVGKILRTIPNGTDKEKMLEIVSSVNQGLCEPLESHLD
jgi:elongation factor 1-alpha